jgi:hypothetical protein
MPVRPAFSLLEDHILMDSCRYYYLSCVIKLFRGSLSLGTWYCKPERIATDLVLMVPGDNESQSSLPFAVTVLLTLCV